MPGLRTTPVEMKKGTRMLLEKHIRTNDFEKCMMYLAVVPAPCGRPNTSLSMELVKEIRLESRTIGVLTKCDLVTSKREIDKLRMLLQYAPNGAPGAVELDPHGWFATMNLSPDSPTGQGNRARLGQQAELETSFFAEHMPSEVKAGQATCDALINKVCSVYHENLRTTWALETMRKLDNALQQARAVNAALGQPETVGPSEEDLLRVQDIATTVAQCKCESYGGDIDSTGCFQKVVSPLIEKLLAIASCGVESKLRASSKMGCHPAMEDSDEFEVKAAAAKEECRRAVLLWGEYWMARCTELLEQDEVEAEGESEELLHNPSFQLGRFPAFLARVKGHLRPVLKANETAIFRVVETLVKDFFDFKSSFVKGIEMDVPGQTSQNTVTLQIDQEALRPLLVNKIRYLFSRFTPGIATVSGIVEKAVKEIGMKEWAEVCGDERAAILKRIHRVEEARHGVVHALGLSNLQVQVADMWCCVY